ncbi:MAG: hypothetical protein PF448_09590 [Bacteroidales bacterium]|nr:hypothetical protein [Bacteroidales bacterium]
MQTQIDALNQKMDLVLEHIQDQKMRSMTMDDLVSDLSIVGKDVYDSSVHALDQQQIEISPDQLRDLALKFIRNIDTFNALMDTLESITDLIKDASPLVTEAIIDFSKELNKLNEKGVFDNSRALLNSITKMLSAGDANKINSISENAELLASVLGKISDPDVLKQLDKLLSALSESSKADIQPKSPLKLVFSKDMKQTSGFLIHFMKTMNKSNH